MLCFFLVICHRKYFSNWGLIFSLRFPIFLLPNLDQCSITISRKNVRKPLAFWCFLEVYLFIFYLIRYLKSMFTIVKKLINIDNKKPNKMKKFKLIKWAGAGRYMSKSNKYQYNRNWTCISLLGETYKYIYIIYTR